MSHDDYGALDDGDPASLSLPERQAAFDALVRVENPADNSPNTFDRASCHLATPTEKLVAMPLFSLDDTTSPLAFQPDGTYVTHGDLAPTFQNQPTNLGPINLHAFSLLRGAAGYRPYLAHYSEKRILGGANQRVR